MKVKCAVCGGPANVRRRDVKAEEEYSRKTGLPVRNWYCSIKCLRAR